MKRPAYNSLADLASALAGILAQDSMSIEHADGDWREFNALHAEIAAWIEGFYAAQRAALFA